MHVDSKIDLNLFDLVLLTCEVEQSIDSLAWVASLKLFLDLKLRKLDSSAREMRFFPNEQGHTSVQRSRFHFPIAKAW